MLSLLCLLAESISDCKIQIEYHLSEKLWTRVFQVSDFGVLEIPWGWDQSLNIKLINVLYTPYSHGLKVIFHNIFTTLTDPHHMRLGVEFRPYGIMLILRKFLILEDFRVLRFSD